MRLSSSVSSAALTLPARAEPRADYPLRAPLSRSARFEDRLRADELRPTREPRRRPCGGGSANERSASARAKTDVCRHAEGHGPRRDPLRSRVSRDNGCNFASRKGRERMCWRTSPSAATAKVWGIASKGKEVGLRQSPRRLERRCQTFAVTGGPIDSKLALESVRIAPNEPARIYIAALRGRARSCSPLSTAACRGRSGRSISGAARPGAVAPRSTQERRTASSSHDGRRPHPPPLRTMPAALEKASTRRTRSSGFPHGDGSRAFVGT